MNRYAFTIGKYSHWSQMSKVSQLENYHSFKSVSSSAGLQLLAKHAFQFSTCFMDHYRTLFELMSNLCGHINPEMKKTSSYALEAFLKQVKTFSSLSLNVLIQIIFLMFMMPKYCLIAICFLICWIQFLPVFYPSTIFWRLHCRSQIILRSTKACWSSSCRSSVPLLRPWTRHIRNYPSP